MLRRLSGRTHTVFTGLALRQAAATGPAQVDKGLRPATWFSRELDEATIEAYLAKVHTLDKAGGYAIQEQGDLIVERYTGSLSNIVGLPVETVKQILIRCGLVRIVLSGFLLPPSCAHLRRFRRPLPVAGLCRTGWRVEPGLVDAFGEDRALGHAAAVHLLLLLVAFKIKWSRSRMDVRAGPKPEPPIFEGAFARLTPHAADPHRRAPPPVVPPPAPPKFVRDQSRRPPNNRAGPDEQHRRPESSRPPRKSPPPTAKAPRPP